MATPKPERLKAADVCQIAQVQPYVLRTWEAEFPDLGRAVDGGARVYSRADIARVLKLRELVFVEGLTLSGARRRLEESAPETSAGTNLSVPLVDVATRTRLLRVRHSLEGLRALLDRPQAGEGFQLVATASQGGRGAPSRGGRRGKRSA